MLFVKKKKNLWELPPKLPTYYRACDVSFITVAEGLTYPCILELNSVNVNRTIIEALTVSHESTVLRSHN